LELPRGAPLLPSRTFDGSTESPDPAAPEGIAIDGAGNLYGTSQYGGTVPSAATARMELAKEVVQLRLFILSSTIPMEDT